MASDSSKNVQGDDLELEALRREVELLELKVRRHRAKEELNAIRNERALRSGGMDPLRTVRSAGS